MQIRNPKYPFKQNGDCGKCPKCFEDFSFTSCANCGSGFEDEYIEVPSETDQLRTTIAEQAARIKALERLVDLDAITLSESNDLLRYRIVQLEEEAKFNFDQYQDMAAEHCKAADEYKKRIAQLEGALRVSRDALDYGDSDKRIDAVTAIDELIGE